MNLLTWRVLDDLELAMNPGNLVAQLARLSFVLVKSALEIIHIIDTCSSMSPAGELLYFKQAQTVDPNQAETFTQSSNLNPSQAIGPDFACRLSPHT